MAKNKKLSFSTKSFRGRAEAYADAVIAGKKPACKYAKQACRRFRSDLNRKDILLLDSAEKWCGFVEKLPHVKGAWAAKQELIKLSDWQIFCIVNLYGWHWKKSGRRRFTEGYIEVPRKNGKSLFAAALGLGHLVLDNEHGAEVYCGATSEKQAWEVFRPAHQICERDHELREHYGIDLRAKNIHILRTGSRFQPVIGKPGDGASPSCAIVDEFHEHQTSDLIDTFQTGMGARQNPMLLAVTTAGADVGGPCYARRSDIIRILDGTVEDDRMFGIIYTLDEEDQWDTVEAIKKANPNFDVSVDADFLKGQLEQARRSATKQNAFKTKHLNVWVGAMAGWMNMLAYQACRKSALKLEDNKGRLAFVGLDMASKSDITSKAIVFPPDEKVSKWRVFMRHYLPEDTIMEGGGTRYKAWHADGWLTATPGNVTDLDYVKDDMAELKSACEIKEIAFDPFQVLHFASQMVDDGYPMVEYGQTVKNFSQAMKEVEGLILQRQVEFDMDPVMLWMMGNVVAKLDKKDNIFPNKDRPENKIDGAIALIMAAARAFAHLGTGDSVYNKRDMLVLNS